MEVPGGYGKVFAKRIHDPCQGACGGSSTTDNTGVALVGLDTLAVPRSLVLTTRAQIPSVPVSIPVPF